MNDEFDNSKISATDLDADILACIEDYRKYNKQDFDQDTYTWTPQELLDYSLRGVSTFDIY